MHRIRWDDLQYVHAVADQGSLSAASRVLGVNHATVLRRIALLEAASEVKLFDRRNDGYRLRPEGRALLASLKLMDHASARIRRSLTSTSKGIEGTFRLATTDAIACLLLPGYLAALTEVHPNINIEIAVSNDPIDLSLSGAEILIRPGTELPPELSGAKAGSVEFRVFGAPAYLEKNRNLTISEHKWLGVAPDFAKPTVGEWQLSSVGTRFEFSADSFLMLAALAAQGLGLALLPAFVGQKTDQLVPFGDIGGEPETGIWVATHKDFRQQRSIEALLGFFTNALAADTRQVNVLT
ncbi:LysR family transcriptional regulator [Labrenzia sp. DG1229]|uniref:LysR family transcriptional regulator n=1 Tax=Labrenzia sp. DG1229 TaxID=681847 RepID=UPI00048E23CA|nr:LysR family transcriptional regulator [Labrenzia sp. DG1229]